MKSDTLHVRACRDAWDSHQANCKACQTYDFAQCPHLGAEFDEYSHAISAHKDLESIGAVFD